MNTRAVMMQGKIKWNVKNHVRVAYLPRLHLRFILLGLFQYKGRMADRRLVITVALPNDICPHGST